MTNTMLSNSKTKAEHIIQQVNVNNVKKLAFLLVVGFIMCHGLIHLLYKADSCKCLLTNGRYRGDKEWYPYGCMKHKYSKIDSKQCFKYMLFWRKENYFLLIGDERMQSIYNALIEHIAENNDETEQQRDHNSTFVDNNLRLRIKYIYHKEVTSGLVNELTKYTKDDTMNPSVVILGLKAHRTSLTKLVKPLEILAGKKQTWVLWRMQDKIIEDNEKMSVEWQNESTDDIERLNLPAYEAFDYTNIKLWSSSRLISSGLHYEMNDRYHLTSLILSNTIQIFLNMYCNDHMHYYDGTCCTSSENFTIPEIATYLILVVCITFASIIFVHQRYIKFKVQTILTQRIRNTSVIDYTTPLFALASLSLILCYFYLCDRTNFFIKENKYYSKFGFWMPIGYIFALGLFFTEGSRCTQVLHRDQIDELKGLMQLCILIYHMTGADRVLPIYMHIKVLISAYIFLLGYEHFTRVWQTGSTNLIRLFQVMFRFNFIAILLCLCMNRSYQFYYLVPLMTFWFCVVYFILSIPPLITSQNLDKPYHYIYLVLKLIVLMSVIRIMSTLKVVFKGIFVSHPWRALFIRTDNVILDWWDQWKMDQYTISYAVTFAAFVHIAQKYGAINDNYHGHLFSRPISVIVTLISIIGIGFYTTFSFLCTDKESCEEIHSYIVFIPIIGYIVLRNIFGNIRARYSKLFSWFGKISIELFVCQCHIWQTANLNGVLVLLPRFTSLNILLTTFIFVCASHEIHRITLVLLPYMVPNNLRGTLRNFIIFLVILIPIARYKIIV